MTRVALVVAYLIGMVASIISLDANGVGGEAWVAVSVLLGAGTGDYRFALLSFLSIPIAIPFGLPADTYSDPVLPTWVAAVGFAPISSALILLAAFMRRIVESRLRRRRTPRDSSVT